MLRRTILRTIATGAGALALAGLGIAGPLPGTAGEARAAEPIKVGFSIAKSGYMAAYDLPALNGALLKIGMINAGGGLLGRPIETVVLDMKTDAALSAKTGAELADMGVDLIVTDSDYDLGAPAALAAKEAGILAFATGAADPKMGVQGVGWQTFTGNGAAQLEGIVMAEFGFKEKGWKKAFVLEDQLLEYNKSGCAGFEAAWKDLGGTIADQDVFMNQDPSIASQIARIKGSGAEVIYLCSLPPGGASAVRQIRAAGIDLPTHLPRIRAYWRKMLLGEAAYRRHTMNIHRAVHLRRPFTAADFERWLALFTATLDAGFAGPCSERARRLATRIAANMHAGLDAPCDEPRAGRDE